MIDLDGFLNLYTNPYLGLAKWNSLCSDCSPDKILKYHSSRLPAFTCTPFGHNTKVRLQFVIATYRVYPNQRTITYVMRRTQVFLLGNRRARSDSFEELLVAHSSVDK
ncbi:b3.2 [Ichnoviriform fugitivi]|uniref:B3.2 n=1 Tax=Ichnoviriform fugitivi TaxID=265522 RepID=A2Q0D6_9VIRU|nr:b3.2 [Ichnoviriform fugitivi]BAF45651.1 b3.2 [Ichnoviriform fugitivi]